jgi:hypothetical protein
MDWKLMCSMRVILTAAQCSVSLRASPTRSSVSTRFSVRRSDHIRCAYAVGPSVAPDAPYGCDLRRMAPTADGAENSIATRRDRTARQLPCGYRTRSRQMQARASEAISTRRPELSEHESHEWARHERRSVQCERPRARASPDHVTPVRQPLAA